MREALFGGPTTSSSSSSKVKQERRMVTQQQPTLHNKPSNVKTVESLQDFKTIVGDETEKLVAVRFHATYCRACNAVAPHFYKLALHHPNVVFVDVPVSERNAVVHQGLGVPSLPYAHIYHPDAGLVEEHKLTRKDIADFRHVLQTYLDGSCDIVEEE
jgi:thiol-disulfide isomerase/thioredoxin